MPHWITVSAFTIASIRTNISFLSFCSIVAMSAIRIIYSQELIISRAGGTGALFHDSATKFNYLYLAGGTYIHYLNLLKSYYLKSQLTKSYHSLISSFPPFWSSFTRYSAKQVIFILTVSFSNLGFLRSTDHFMKRIIQYRFLHLFL